MRLVFLAIILVELLSVFGWAMPGLGNAAFLAVLALALVLSLQDLRYGVGIMVAELITGSHGYLLSFQHEGLSVSLRIGLFLVVLAVSLVKAAKERHLAVRHTRVFWPLVALAVVIIYAAIRGAMVGNGFANVFFDANAFFYFGAAIPFFQAVRTKGDWALIMKVAVAALLASAFKVLLLTYMFSHEIRFWYIIGETYRWVRDTRIGEITAMSDTFFRIFFQSQIYTAMAFCILIAVSTYRDASEPFKVRFKGKKWWAVFGFFTVLVASTLMSLSRSNWLGLAVAAVVFLASLFWLIAKPAKHLWYAFSTVLLSGIASILLIATLVIFPFPPASGGFSGSLFSKRALTFTDEAGASSRWNLLPPLMDAILAHPILGQGFGKQVTYKTLDPRLLADNPTGEYTTFIFEWGYHDLWLKLGLLGFIAYGWLLLSLLAAAYHYLKNHRYVAMNDDAAFVWGATLGLIALLVTHTFSPYINHPLGIGYLLLFAVLLEVVMPLKPHADRLT